MWTSRGAGDRALQSQHRAHTSWGWERELTHPASSVFETLPTLGRLCPSLHYLPAEFIGGGEGQWQCLVTVLELRRLGSALNSISGWLEGYLLGGSVYTAGWHGRAGNERKYVIVLGLIRLISIPFILLTLLKHSVIFYGSCAKTGVLNSCDIHVVILGNRVLYSIPKSNFVFLRGSAISNKPLMLFCLRRVYKIKMRYAMNHMDIEFPYSALFWSERLLHKIVLFFF